MGWSQEEQRRHQETHSRCFQKWATLPHLLGLILVIGLAVQTICFVVYIICFCIINTTFHSLICSQMNTYLNNKELYQPKGLVFVLLGCTKAFNK